MANEPDTTAAPPAQPTPSERKLLAARGNDFAAALYSHLAGPSGSVFFAPANVWAALGMTYAGAGGETATEMAGALRLPEMGPGRLHAGLGWVADTARTAPGVELASANGLFGQSGAGFLPDFVALLAANYGAGLREVDFAGATEQAREAINAWVLEQTQQQVANLIPSGVLDELTRLVLASAIYFRGKWEYEFPEERTTPEPFFRLDGGSSPAPLMRRTGEYGLIDIDGGQVIELPYREGKVSMVVILPSAKDGLPALEARVPAELGTWLAAIDSGRSCNVDLSLPRFRIEAALRLDPALKALGMARAFDPTAADFSGMNGRVADLYITAALHSAFVDVNEQGTTAAAATAVVMGTRSAGPHGDPVVFRADHPFLFLIRHTRRKSVLFLGRLTDPAG